MSLDNKFEITEITQGVVAINTKIKAVIENYANDTAFDNASKVKVKSYTEKMSGAWEILKVSKEVLKEGVER